MLEQGHPATIVYTASMAGLFPVAKMAPYCASKFGIVGMSESLNAKLRPRGIRVIALCPGIINTSIVRDGTLRGQLGADQQKIVAFYDKRGVSPDTVAADLLDAIARPRGVVISPPWQVHGPIHVAPTFATAGATAGPRDDQNRQPRLIEERRSEMKTVTCTNAKLEVVDRPTPTPAKGQLLIDVLRCGICGSDLHARHHCDELADVMAESGYDAFMRSNQQVVFGHEFCGEVVDYGPGTRKTPAARHAGRGPAAAAARQGRARRSGCRPWRPAPTPSSSSSSTR